MGNLSKFTKGISILQDGYKLNIGIFERISNMLKKHIYKIISAVGDSITNIKNAISNKYHAMWNNVGDFFGKKGYDPKEGIVSSLTKFVTHNTSDFFSGTLKKLRKVKDNLTGKYEAIGEELNKIFPEHTFSKAEIKELNSIIYYSMNEKGNLVDNIQKLKSKFPKMTYNDLTYLIHNEKKGVSYKDLKKQISGGNTVVALILLNIFSIKDVSDDITIDHIIDITRVIKSVDLVNVKFIFGKLLTIKGITVDDIVEIIKVNPKINYDLLKKYMETSELKKLDLINILKTHIDEINS